MFYFQKRTIKLHSEGGIPTIVTFNLIPLLVSFSLDVTSSRSRSSILFLFQVLMLCLPPWIKITRDTTRLLLSSLHRISPVSHSFVPLNSDVCLGLLILYHSLLTQQSLLPDYLFRTEKMMFEEVESFQCNFTRAFDVGLWNWKK